MNTNLLDDWKSSKFPILRPLPMRRSSRKKLRDRTKKPQSRLTMKGETINVYVLLIALVVGLMTVTSGISPASALACQAQFGVPNIYSLTDAGHFQVAVPLLGTCSFEPFGTGGHLYARTAVVDLKSNVAIGSDYTILVPAENSYGFGGYVDLTLPLAAQYDQLQFFVAVYSNQGGFSSGSLLTTASSTFLLGSSYYQGNPSYPYYLQGPPSSSGYPPYPLPPSYPYYPGNSCNYNCGYLPPSVNASCYYPGPQAYPSYPYYPTKPC
jgi:hypothetical protein